MAKISIIIPCFNAEKYICRCLNGLLMQTYKDFDVVLVNDCSKDATVKTVKEWLRKYELNIQILTNKVNRGPSLSRYNGAKQIHSEWVAFCDSDDWFEPEFLERMIAKAQKDKCDMVFCGYRNVIGSKLDNHPLGDKDLVLTPMEAMCKNVNSLCMTLVKRDIYISTPQPDIRNGEDMALIPLMIQRVRNVGILSDVLYNYYIRPGSASQSPSNKMVESLIKSFDFIHHNLESSYYFEKEFLGIRNLVYGCLLNLFKYSYNTSKANSILRDFEKVYPNWINNKMLDQLSVFKRIYVWCAYHRLYFVMWVLSRIHSLMLK